MQWAKSDRACLSSLLASESLRVHRPLDGKRTRILPRVPAGHSPAPVIPLPPEMLFHRRHVPQPPLSQYIENLWLVRGKLPTRWRNMIFPDGAMEMILNLGDPQKLCDRANPTKHTIFKRSWISGERVEPIVVEEAGAINLVGVRFKPGG